MKKRVILSITTLFFLCFSIVLYLKFPSYFLQFEDKINDMMFLTRGEEEITDKIEIKKLGVKSFTADKLDKLLDDLQELSQ